MNIFVVSGSRNLEGQTAQACHALKAGAETKGATVEMVFLPTLKITRCEQCDERGWGTCRTAGQCSVADDFQGVVNKVRQADLVVFATPVYFRDLSESLRTFLDRLRRICIIDAGKESILNKPAVGICVAGGSGNGAPECSAILDRILSTIGFFVLDMEPIRRQNLEIKLSNLKSTGAWLATAKPGSQIA